MVQITGCEPEMSRELIEELERERRRNFIDRLKHVDWEVEQILKDHRKWFEIQAEWSKRYYEALYRQMDKDPKLKKIIIESILKRDKLRKRHAILK